MTPEGQKFDFYHQQFKAHTARIFDYQKDRLKVALLSMVGTAGYFAWLISHLPQSSFVRLPMLFVPFVFNIMGLVYTRSIDANIDFHVGFLNFIETDILKVANAEWDGNSAWSQYRSQTTDSRWRKRTQGHPIRKLSYSFWTGMIAVSLVLAIAILWEGDK
jgi:hypothetical protein